MKVIKVIVLFLFIACLGYIVGPKPNSPQLDKEWVVTLPDDLITLEKQIKNRESATEGIKKGNEAQFVWNDSVPQKTEVAFLYLHGFSASEEEGDPVHRNLAKKYAANLYLARLAEHGIDLKDETMANLTADKLIQTAEEALAITKKMGKEVIIIGTSAGGALTAYLASKHPEIKAILLYSPCISIYDRSAKLLDMPWGLEMARIVQGKDFNDIVPKNKVQPRYWSIHYRLEALVALQNFISHTMLEETFQKISCPTLLAYYYKNHEEQDKVVSVPAMLSMYEQLGTEPRLKRKVALPTTQHHVIGSYVLSEDWQATQNTSISFLEEVVGL